MAASQNRSSNNRKQGSKPQKPSGHSGSRSGRTSNRSGAETRRQREEEALRREKENAMGGEIALVILFALMVLLFLCNFGIIGTAGDAMSGILFGLFGLLAYISPVGIFLAVAFYYANPGNGVAIRKLIAGICLFFLTGAAVDMVTGLSSQLLEFNASTLFALCRDKRSGGGLISGSLAYFLSHFLGTVGAVLVLLLGIVICMILLTERSLIGFLRSGGENLLQSAENTRRELEDSRRERQQLALSHREEEEIEPTDQKALLMENGAPAITEETAVSGAPRRTLMEEMRERREAQNQQRDQKKEEIRSRREEEKRLRQEEKEAESILKIEMPTPLQNHTSEMHEIRYGQEDHFQDFEEEDLSISEEPDPEPVTRTPGFTFEKLPVREVHQVNLTEAPLEETLPEPDPEPQAEVLVGDEPEPLPRPVVSEPKRPAPEKKPVAAPPAEKGVFVPDGEAFNRRKYQFPPLNLLMKGKAISNDMRREQEEVKENLRSTLESFGVMVRITDVSQGPTVTRYELQPEQGVKISRIVGLADDIKLNLAATDIRIEAPIPGKAAVGIEVPNREVATVCLRDLLESKAFKDSKSNLTFAVGKDLAGQTVVTDIAKMPHVLIAGSTGSGKSVCINTLIMSLLYKASPEDVQMVLVDPKVVELSVYNGIPHLAIPVVTDPKKASAALQWGVKEMEDRYRKFADFAVRDLKGYNEKAQQMRESGDPEAPAKLPQIVIIIDELADLMMVAPGEVEESICRLAQLARAAGIHLVVATQRPSVDVITGLIKANMPSRIAFAVSSGVDSRTILDRVGAEKLLGKGDMLFYPQGYPNPARVQGAFVSDEEVSRVTEFLRNQRLNNPYADQFASQIGNLELNSGSSSSSGNGGEEDGLDEYFIEAGRCVVGSKKSSIGNLQRALKIGFNRAARIMDSLSEYGVVGPEQGTKPREILMTEDQFEELVRELRGQQD